MTEQRRSGNEVCIPDDRNSMISALLLWEGMRFGRLQLKPLLESVGAKYKRYRSRVPPQCVAMPLPDCGDVTAHFNS